MSLNNESVDHANSPGEPKPQKGLGSGQRWAVPSTKVPRYCTVVFFSTVTGTDDTFSKMVPKYRYRGTFLKSIRYF